MAETDGRRQKKTKLMLKGKGREKGRGKKTDEQGNVSEGKGNENKD